MMTRDIWDVAQFVIESNSEQLDSSLRKLKEERPRAAVVTAREVSRIVPAVYA
ncbi:MAG: hypothetical protein ABSA96_12825 [Candidatus Acidiferrales bacterium]